MQADSGDAAYLWDMLERIVRRPPDDENSQH